IDGEVTDMNRIEQLKAMLQGDDQLQADYDAQREVKLLLAELPEAEAPSFMATRIMGEISSRRNMRRGKLWLPNWGAAAAAVALFGMGYGMAVQFADPASSLVASPMIATDTSGGPITAGPGARLLQDPAQIDVNPAFNTTQLAQYTPDAFEAVYAASSDVAIPADADPWLREFIELGNEAHNYSRAIRITHNLVSPDVSQAVMVVDGR
nr:hypothetical protein [bacterium]